MYPQPGYNQSYYGTPQTVMPQTMMPQTMYPQPMMVPVSTPVYPYMSAPQNNAPIIINLDNGSKKDYIYCQFCQH